MRFSKAELSSSRALEMGTEKIYLMGSLQLCHNEDLASGNAAVANRFANLSFDLTVPICPCSIDMTVSSSQSMSDSLFHSSRVTRLRIGLKCPKPPERNVTCQIAKLSRHMGSHACLGRSELA